MGAKLAREGGVSVCGDVGCAGLIASKLAPTVFLCRTQFCVHWRFCVGASLLAIAVAQPQRCWHVSPVLALALALALALDLDLDAPLNHAGRTQALRSGHPGMDAGIAALGHGWPFAAAHGAMPECGHTEPKRGAEWWGRALLVTFGALPKVTRCKSGTISSRYRRNGYTHQPRPLGTDNQKTALPSSTGLFMRSDS